MVNTAAIYKTAPRSSICIAFAAAALIHIGAVALAGSISAESPVAGSTMGPGNTEVFLIPEAEPPAPTIDEPETPQPPPLPPVEEWVPEENATPRPVVEQREATRRLVRAVTQPAARNNGVTSAKVMAVSAPRPEYPYEARRQHLTGSGVATVTIDSTGIVTDVWMSQSTGSALLDQAATNGFRRWRFKPGTQAKVQTPITFTLTGAAF